jgi:HD superfamily phosphodiesterase
MACCAPSDKTPAPLALDDPECAAAYSAIEAFFVRKMSARAPHHGWEHAVRVLRWASAIDPKAMCVEVVTLALLHDVLDHKFEDVAQADFDALVLELMPASPPERALLYKAIDAVSFSKEKKRGFRWYEGVLDARWLAWRNIVSDADKLEALGSVGFARCYEVSREFALKRGETPCVSKLLEDVVQHCHDKLFRLGAEYMRTAAGVAFAKEQTSVLRDELYARGIPEVALRT